jgi:hypothetical protein
LVEHPVSYALKLVALALTTAKDPLTVAWRRAAYFAVAGAGAVIIWYGFRFGWPLLAAGLLMEVGDWALIHIPYEPRVKHPCDIPWL